MYWLTCNHTRLLMTGLSGAEAAAARQQRRRDMIRAERDKGSAEQRDVASAGGSKAAAALTPTADANFWGVSTIGSGEPGSADAGAGTESVASATLQGEPPAAKLGTERKSELAQLVQLIKDMDMEETDIGIPVRANHPPVSGAKAGVPPMDVAPSVASAAVAAASVPTAGSVSASEQLLDAILSHPIATEATAGSSTAVASAATVAVTATAAATAAAAASAPEAATDNGEMPLPQRQRRRGRPVTEAEKATALEVSSDALIERLKKTSEWTLTRDALRPSATAGLQGAQLVPKAWAVTRRMTPTELQAAEARFVPAYRWGFQLDSFQREAIAHMEMDGPKAAVFVAAHTSAGKTVVAEYAIALAMSHKAKAIYTSPIKALSNQKYQDLRQRFGGPDGKGVGIITGDVSINADAPCLIMTTEILRSMLYRGDSLIRSIEWVIFDEIHYLNNEERGLAYEEILLLIPERIGLVFLSATTPNKDVFAEWVGSIKRKPVYVLSTPKRPVPLNHYLYSAFDASLTQIMDGHFVDIGDPQGWKNQSYKALNDKLQAWIAKRGKAAKSGPKRTNTGGKSGGGSTKSDKRVWSQLVALLQKQDLLPTIVFSFSRKLVEDCAFLGLGSIDLTTAKEKAAVHMFVDQCVRKLSPVDRALPQITRLKSLLLRGIGVHHAGLLPILKEVVELLFGRGLVKILFATETFAMGINMPARSVVYNGIRKNDGNKFRNLDPGEYTQMAGRAGRRGLDTRGTVIVMAWGEALPEEATLRSMMMGTAKILKSQFRLTYNLLLNILRTDLPLTQFMARSFAEFGTQQLLGGVDIQQLMGKGLRRLEELRARSDALPCIRRDAQTAFDAASAASKASVAGRFDSELLDIEDSGKPLPAVVRQRNAHAVQGYGMAMDAVRRQHLNAVAAVLQSNPDKRKSILNSGRVVIVESITVTVPSETRGAPVPVVLRHVPAVVLSYQEIAAAPSASASSTASLIPGLTGPGSKSFDALLTVVFLCPRHFQKQARTPGGPLGGSATESVSTASAEMAEPAPEFKAIGKKGKGDDDLDLFFGGGAGKGAKGKKGPSGGKGASVSAQSPVPDPVTLAVAARPDPDFPVALGHRQRFDTTFAAPSGALNGDDGNTEDDPLTFRVFGVDRVALSSVTRISSASLAASTEPALARVLTPAPGSMHALEDVAKGLWEVVQRHKADSALEKAALVAQGHGHATGKEHFSYAAYNLPLLNPLASANTGGSAAAVSRSFQALEEQNTAAKSIKCHGCPRFDAQYDVRRRISALETHLAAVRRAFGMETLALYPEMQTRFQLLRDLRYIKASEDSARAERRQFLLQQWMSGGTGDGSAAAYAGGAGIPGLNAGSRAFGVASRADLDVVALKGRVAIEVNTCDELIFTEMVFQGVLNLLSPAELAALLCALVNEDKGNRQEEARGDIQTAEDELDALLELSAGGGSLSSKAAAAIAAAAARAAAVNEDEEGAVEEEEDGEADEDEAEGDAGSVPVTPAEPATPVATPGLPDAATDASGSQQQMLPEVSDGEYTGPTVTGISPSLAEACKKLRAIALRLGELQAQAGLPIVPSVFASRAVNFGLVLPTFAWARGVPFVRICRLTPTMEGIVVRTINRVDETCREVRNAARILGDPLLFKKAELASTAIKRDVIFATSLYLQ
jgi:superfamily II RNA helicase